MSDHKISIGVDVKQNNGVDQLRRGFDSVTRSANDLQSAVKEMSKSSSDMLTRGWGSERYTNELREQFRTMQNMANLLDRQARQSGNNDALGQVKQIQQTIKESVRDLNSLPNSPRGFQTPTTAGKMGNVLSKSLMGWLAYKGMSAAYQGFSAAQSMLPAQAAIAKTMAPGGGNMAWANAMLGAGQGYGYNNNDIMSGAQVIKGATGYTPGFFSQIQGVAQFGRSYGFDYTQAANYYANAYQSGVTGGSSQQMSWQQYAVFVANAVQAANMRGREGQFIESVQQLTNIAQQSNVNAPSQNAVAGIYATAARTGNQAFLNQFPQIMGQVNAGMMSPGMGPMGQAAMWQAVAPGQSYWNAQYQMSLGAFGKGTNGNTNFQNMMQYAYGHFGGNSTQSAVMMSQWLGISPAQAMQLMNTYMKGGKFQSTTFGNSIKNINPNMSPLDLLNQANVNASQQQQSLMSNFNGPWAWLQNTLFGNPVSTAITTGGGAALSAYLTYQGIKKLRGGSPFGGGPGPKTGGGSKLKFGSLPDEPRTTGFLDFLRGPLAHVLDRGLGIISGGVAMDAMTPIYAAQMITGPASTSPNTYQQALQRYKAWSYQNTDKASLAHKYQVTDPNAPWNNGHAETHSSSANRTRSRVSPQENAQNVVSTILALRPSMGIIKNALGDDSTGQSGVQKLLASMSSASSVPLSSSVLQALQSGTYVPPMNDLSGITPTNGYSGKGATSFVNKMKPYALQAAKRMGIPTALQDNFAEFALSQWALESGMGSSIAAHQNDNFGGIKPWGTTGPGKDSMYAGYSSLSDWANGYADFLTKNSRYSNFVSAARNGMSPGGLAQMLGQTGYAEDPGYTSGIMSMFQSIASNYSKAPSTAQTTIRVKSDPIKINLVDALGKVLGTAWAHLTSNATMAGQSPVSHPGVAVMTP